MKRSPYWYISYWCPAKLRRIQRATEFRVDDPAGQRRALARAAELSREAGKLKGIARKEAWDIWVPTWITDRYGRRDGTLTRYRNAWDCLRLFLSERKVASPMGLTHQHIVDYVAWRTAQKRNAGKPISRNTALVEIKVLRIIMREAVRRGFAQGNPCDRHGIQKIPAALKPEITDAEIARIRQLLAAKEGGRPVADRWMSNCFEIALHQGCRLRETEVPLDAVDLKRNTILFEAKGRDGEKHIFTTHLHPGLRPLFEQLREAGAQRSCRLPPRASLDWHEFFKQHGMGHLCFHCTRVTVVTRLARAGVPSAQAMRFVGHSSEIVHAIYQRLQTPDLSAAVAALSSLSAGGGSCGLPPNRDAPPASA